MPASSPFVELALEKPECVDSALHLVGRSAPMRYLRELIARASRSHAHVLLRGERGAGKELTARALHDLSPRVGGPFLAFECGSVPAALLERELFGQEYGRSGARSRRVGLLQRARGGTLFLDEIAALPSHVQSKLLRALHDRTFRPLGTDREQPFDTRIVAATHIDLAAATALGSFRADLYLFLNVLSIDVPPLRARRDDIPLLAARFVGEFARRDGKFVAAIAAPARACLERHAWRGNVRELRACMEHAVAMTEDEVIELDDLPPRVREASLPGGTPRQDVMPVTLPSLCEIERRHIIEVLKAVDGNKIEAAKILGIDRKTLVGRLARYGWRPRPVIADPSNAAARRRRRMRRRQRRSA